MTDEKRFGIVPKTVSLENLISSYGGQGLRIPPYQRGYEWNARNIQRFVDTLLEEFDKSKTTQNGTNPIFLGPIQISEEKGTQIISSIVDGRQRITTLALLEAFLSSKEQNQNGASIASLLYGQDDQQLTATVNTLLSGKVEPYATMSEANPSVLRLTRKAKHDAEACQDIYMRNARFIATILHGKEDKTKGLIEYLKQNLFFIVVVVKDRDLTSIIKIFDSMNSTGQPLSDEAMFKLRFYAHIRSVESDEKPADIMEHINETYRLVERYNENHPTHIKMSDVLWGFRLFCVAKRSDLIDDEDSLKEIKADTFTMPTLQFFELLFALQGTKVSLNAFREYVVRHIRFYEQAYSQTSWKGDGRKAFLYSLPDGFGFTRYPSFWALPIVEFALNQKGIDEALSDCSSVFQAALAWSVCYDKANKKFRTTFLFDVLEAMGVGKPLEKLSQKEMKRIEADRPFWDKVQKDIYDSYRQAYLLLAILGVQDEVGNREGRTFGEALSLYFMTSGEKRPQLEHIYAKTHWEKTEDTDLKSRLNGLGNLVPLEARINKGDNKAELPSIKFGEKAFFGNSSIVSVRYLIALYKRLYKTNLNNPAVWANEIAALRFQGAKGRLIKLMPLLRFDF